MPDPGPETGLVPGIRHSSAGGCGAWRERTLQTVIRGTQGMSAEGIESAPVWKPPIGGVTAVPFPAAFGNVA